MTTPDTDVRPTWKHRSGCTYMPVFGDFFGNPQAGYTHEWSGLAGPTTFAQARRAGFEAQDSDDFNIAVIESKQVVALLWMDEDMQEEASVLDELTEAIAGWLT